MFGSRFVRLVATTSPSAYDDLVKTFAVTGSRFTGRLYPIQEGELPEELAAMRRNVLRFSCTPTVLLPTDRIGDTSTMKVYEVVQSTQNPDTAGAIATQVLVAEVPGATFELAEEEE